MSIQPNQLIDDILICNHPPQMTLRRTDGSHATYDFPLGHRTKDLALERRIIARMEYEMRLGAVIVESNQA